MYIPGFVPKTISVKIQKPYILVVTFDTDEVKALDIEKYIDKHEEMANLKTKLELFKKPEVSICGYMTVWKDATNYITFHNDYVYWHGKRITEIQ